MISANDSAAAGTAQVSPKSLFDQWKSGDLIEGGFRWFGNDRVSTKEAKKDFFLTPDDLARLSCGTFGGGIGCGAPSKVYRLNDVVSASLSKFGRAEIEKKLASRQMREEKKRMKEHEAELARKRLKTNTTVNEAASAFAYASSTVASATSKAPAGDKKEIAKLRGSLLRMAKKNMGFERSGAPKSWCVEVPGTTAATFAALMDRPEDVDLATFVKNGAYYTIQGHDATRLFGVKDDEKLTKYFSREMCAQQIGDTVVVRYKPSSMDLSVSGYAEWPASW